MRDLFLISLFLLGGCKHEEDFKPLYDVPAEFQPFVDSFLHEASLRGHSISINNLIIAYDEKVENPYCGNCNSNSMDMRIQKKISINPNVQC